MTVDGSSLAGRLAPPCPARSRDRQPVPRLELERALGRNGVLSLVARTHQNVSPLRAWSSSSERPGRAPSAVREERDRSFSQHLVRADDSVAAPMAAAPARPTAYRVFQEPEGIA